MDMANHTNQMASDNHKRNENKKYMKSELNLAMRHREQKNDVDRINKAFTEEQHKDGPPMMKEFGFNQERIEVNTKKVNLL